MLKVKMHLLGLTCRTTHTAYKRKYHAAKLEETLICIFIHVAKLNFPPSSLYFNKQWLVTPK